MFVAPGVIADGGGDEGDTAAGLTGTQIGQLSITNPHAGASLPWTGLGLYSAPLSQPYQSFTAGFDSSGNFIFDVESNGGAPVPGAFFKLNGVLFPLPGLGTGTVSSAGLSVPSASIFGVTGSPITTSGTLGLTTTGSSGGLLYFSASNKVSSSAALTGLVLGNGAGSAPTAYPGVSGQANKFVSALSASGTGTLTQPATTNLSDITTFSLNTNGSVTSSDSVTSTRIGSANFVASTAAGFTRDLAFQTSGLYRFNVFVDSSPESGGNAGSNFGIANFNDVGTFTGVPLAINRSTGLVTLNGFSAARVGGALTNGHCLQADANGNVSDAGAACGLSGGGGSVTSVGLSVPGSSIFGVMGSPIVGAGTLGLTTTGTSGGIPYFSSGAQIASSGALTGLVKGNGAGSAPTAFATVSGSDLTLPGALTIANTGGVKLQAGSQTGTNPWLNTLYEQTPGELSTFLHGVYSHNTSSFVGISNDFTAANDPTNSNADSPRNTLTIFGVNSGSVAFANGLLAIIQCTVANTGCGHNLIAAGGGTPGAKKIVGLEIDQDFAVGDSDLGGSAGIYLNTFNVNGSGTAIQLGAIAGYWSDGIAIGGLAPNNSAGLFAISGASMGSMVNTVTSGTYSNGAIVVGNYNGSNGSLLGFYGTAGYAGDLNVIFTDSSNNFILRQNTGSGIFLQSGGTTMLEAATASPSSRTTAVGLLYNGGSGISFQNVSIGDTDSCGIGFSCLRVPN